MSYTSRKYYFYFFITLFAACDNTKYKASDSTIDTSSVWVGPSSNQLPNTNDSASKEIVYGYDLITHTSKYYGPKGSLGHSTNGMKCAQCHVDAGTRPFGLNYGAVYSTYPKYRDRSGTIETIYKRVNDCFERSLNGKALDSNSKEMKAIYAYLQWVGKGIKKGEKVKGSGYEQLPFMQVAADTLIGAKLYLAKCAACHQPNGNGIIDSTGVAYLYPPLWGATSYNSGAGLHQNSKLAGFIKNNMPSPTNYKKPQLTNEEAWHIASFINHQPRPSKDISRDWPDLSKKPFDYPYGPYIDSFSTDQHRYGPYQPIIDYYKTVEKNKAIN